jgi:hypothetical protein
LPFRGHPFPPVRGSVIADTVSFGDYLLIVSNSSAGTLLFSDFPATGPCAVGRKLAAPKTNSRRLIPTTGSGDTGAAFGERRLGHRYLRTKLALPPLPPVLILLHLALLAVASGIPVIALISAFAILSTPTGPLGSQETRHAEPLFAVAALVVNCIG